MRNQRFLSTFFPFLVVLISTKASAYSPQSPIYFFFINKTGKNDGRTGKDVYRVQKRLTIEGITYDDANHDDSTLVLYPRVEGSLGSEKATHTEIENVNTIRFKFSNFEIANEKRAVLLNSPDPLILVAKIEEKSLSDIQIFPVSPELRDLKEGEEISADSMDRTANPKLSDSEETLRAKLQKIEERVREVEEKKISYWKRMHQKFLPLSYDKKLKKVQQKLEQLTPDDPEVEKWENKKEALDELGDEAWEEKFKESRAIYWKKINRIFFPVSVENKLRRLDKNLNKVAPDHPKVEKLAEKEALIEVKRLDRLRKIEEAKSAYWKRMRRGLSPWELDRELAKVESQLKNTHFLRRKKDKLEIKTEALKELIQEISQQKPEGIRLASDILNFPCESGHTAKSGDFFCNLSAGETATRKMTDDLFPTQLPEEIAGPQPRWLYADDPRVPPGFAALGNMFQVGNIIWSEIVTQITPAGEIEAARAGQREAAAFCHQLGGGSKLPEPPHFEILRQYLGFPDRYNPHLIPGLKGEKLWSMNSGETRPSFFWAFYGKFEEVPFQALFNFRCIIEVPNSSQFNKRDHE